MYGLRRGIYFLINAQTGAFYIGSSVNMNKRVTQHMGQLRKQKHYNNRLQTEFDHNPCFSFEYREYPELMRDQLISKEQEYLDSYKPSLNIATIADPLEWWHKGIKGKHKAKYSRAICHRLIQHLEQFNPRTGRNSLSDFSTYCKIDAGTYSAALRGKVTIGKHRLDKLAEAMGLDISTIYSIPKGKFED